IAFMLMEMNVFAALGDILGLYSNIAIAWMMAVVADLVINKPLGLSPKGIEFKRAYLYDINPVGVGAMALASILSVAAHLGFFGLMAQAFSALIALATALITSPLIAWATRGKYYLARVAEPVADVGAYPRLRLQRCVICERDYEGPDMAHCPAYRGPICSLCCTLDARCGDLCKPHASLASQWSATLRWLFPKRIWTVLDKGLGYFLLAMLVIVPLLAAVFGLLYQQEFRTLSLAETDLEVMQAPYDALRSGFLKAYMALLLIAGLVAWWVVLAHQSRRVAQDESNRQTSLLLREIELHRQTDAALQLAKQAAERANQAKSRYISAISHELRTPLNSILGYDQLMGQDTGIPAHRKQAVAVIKRGGEHLLSLIEGTLDLARIEAGRLTLNPRPLAFADFMQDLADMFALEAERKALRFVFEVQGKLPAMVRADEKRVRQILLNLMGNAIKFTSAGQVCLRLRYAVEMAHIEVEDTGPGLSAQDLAHVFEPFARANVAGLGAPGAGMGLTIARMLT
ncbi:MAG TPA: ATP-binding protein, partial [Rhodoferax sp.]|nr:ATP-binding protein [Rhodoferax sp.]